MMGDSCSTFLQARGTVTEYVLTLPEVSITDVPRMSGIYFVVNADDQVVYVGVSVDINQRWRGHKLRASAIANTWRIFVKPFNRDRFFVKEQEEAWFIATLWPEHNRLIKCST